MKVYVETPEKTYIFADTDKFRHWGYVTQWKFPPETAHLKLTSMQAILNAIKERPAFKDAVMYLGTAVYLRKYPHLRKN